MCGQAQKSIAWAKPTGAHSLKVGDVDGGELVAKDIHEFEKSDGTPWIPMMMRPTEIVVRATIDGRPCTYEQQFTQ